MIRNQTFSQILLVAKLSLQVLTPLFLTPHLLKILVYLLCPAILLINVQELPEILILNSSYLLLLCLTVPHTFLILLRFL